MTDAINARIYDLIAKRDKALGDLNSLLPYEGYDDFRERKFHQERSKRQQALAAANEELESFVKQTYPDCLVEGDIPATIAKIMEEVAFPQPGSATLEEDINPFR